MTDKDIAALDEIGMLRMALAELEALEMQHGAVIERLQQRADATVLEARNAALDEAASACQRIAGNVADFPRDHRRAAGQCAAMILALKEKPHDA